MNTSEAFSVSCPKITNVKCHFKLKSCNDRLKSLCETAGKKVGKKFHNFYVLRQQGLVFVVFPSGGHINVSGIKGLGSEVQQAKKVFCDLISAHEQENPVVIDNITAVCSINSSPVNLVKLKEKVEGRTKKKTTVSLRPYSFPSAVLRTKNSPTLQVFSSGKVVIVGGRSREEIQLASKKLCALIRQL